MKRCLPAPQKQRQAGLSSSGEATRPSKAGPGGKKLKKTHEYRRVYTNGRVVRGETFWVYILPACPSKTEAGEPARPLKTSAGKPADEPARHSGTTAGEPAPRIGISVGRKKIKKATDRNRVKRIIRSWFSQIAESRPRKGYDAVIVVKKAVAGGRSGSVEMRKELSSLFRRAVKLL